MPLALHHGRALWGSARSQELSASVLASVVKLLVRVPWTRAPLSLSLPLCHIGCRGRVAELSQGGRAHRRSLVPPCIPRCRLYRDACLLRCLPGTHLAPRLALSRLLCACSWARSFSWSTLSRSCSSSCICSSACFSRAASARLSASRRPALSPRSASWMALEVRASSPPKCSRSLGERAQDRQGMGAGSQV